MSVSFLVSFQVISNRLWAYTKQKKGHCVRTISSQGFNLYNIERENPFEGRLLVCKVAKRVGIRFQVVAYKEIVTFPSEWEV